MASFPISTLLPGVNLNATLLSHGNSLDFGLLGDRHALPDLERVVEGMAFHFAALEAAALGSRPAGAAIKAATKTMAKKCSRASSKTPRKARSGAEAGAQAKRGAADAAVARAKTRGNTVCGKQQVQSPGIPATLVGSRVQCYLRIITSAYSDGTTNPSRPAALKPAWSKRRSASKAPALSPRAINALCKGP